MENMTAILLAGGKSSRMGQDKGLMLLDGIPMIKHLITTCEKLTSNIIIIANTAGYESFGYPVYADYIQNKGPLAGIVTGLLESTTEANWVISCDSPYVSQTLLLGLAKASKNNEVVISSFQQKLHPLIGVYCKSVLVTLQEQIRCDNLKVLGVLDSLNTTTLNGNHLEAVNFKNLNSPQDL